MLLSQKDRQLLWGHCKQVRKILNGPGVGHRPVISLPWRLRQEDCKFKVSKSYTVSSRLAQLSDYCLKNKSVLKGGGQRQWQRAQGLHRSGPDGVPVLRGEVDTSPHP